MMKKVCIARAEIATGLGDTLEGTWEGMLSGDCAIGAIEHFSVDRLGFPLASCIRKLWRQEAENRICALMGRALDRFGPIPRSTFLIWTGLKGNAEYIESGQAKGPPLFPCHYRQWVADQLGLSGGGIEINAACASSTVGLAVGAMKIARGERSSVLVCAADLVTRFVHTGFSALRALTPTACRPFDRRRNGLCLGDGAVAVWLTDEETARRYGNDRPVRLVGWGASNDATHITGPARNGRGLVAAITAALEMAGVDPDRVGAFCPHGTGTVFNDGMEIAAMETVFGSRKFPVFSVKGAIGHTLGAAGAVEAAIGVRCLEEKIVPPTVGLQDPEAGVVGRVSPGIQPFAGEVLLTTNSGFGGVNAALVLSRKRE